MTAQSPPDSPAVVIVVDVANVMGARADGWWRDRAGAALRLCREVGALAARGIPRDRLSSGGLSSGGLSSEGLPSECASSAGPSSAPAFPRYVLVLEGRAREAAGRIDSANPRTRIVQAPGSGDDTIVAESAAAVAGEASCLAVTADRELRERCRGVGAAVRGPGWLLDLL
ncbi:MAG TPA: hypothetical protein VG142_11300 [Trebonia sp.]|nr:hypothetical protein [Trebonia sp.]